MHEMYPGKIIKVSSLAGDHEARGQYAWLLCTVVVDVARSVGLKRVGLQFKVAGIKRSEQAAARADHPTREGCHGNADQHPCIKRVMGDDRSIRGSQTLF